MGWKPLSVLAVCAVSTLACTHIFEDGGSSQNPSSPQSATPTPSPIPVVVVPVPLPTAVPVTQAPAPNPNPNPNPNPRPVVRNWR